MSHHNITRRIWLRRVFFSWGESFASIFIDNRVPAGPLLPQSP